MFVEESLDKQFNDKLKVAIESTQFLDTKMVQIRYICWNH